jgi:hypothetical protein
MRDTSAMFAPVVKSSVSAFGIEAISRRLVFGNKDIAPQRVEAARYRSQSRRRQYFVTE